MLGHAAGSIARPEAAQRLLHGRARIESPARTQERLTVRGGLQPSREAEGRTGLWAVWLGAGSRSAAGRGAPLGLQMGRCLPVARMLVRPERRVVYRQDPALRAGRSDCCRRLIDPAADGRSRQARLAMLRRR